MIIDCVPKQSCCYQTSASWLVQCYFAAKWGSACACGNAYQRMYCAQLNCSSDGISQVTVVLFHSSAVLSLWSAFAVDVVVLNMLNAQQSLDVQQSFRSVPAGASRKALLGFSWMPDPFSNKRAFWNNEGHGGSVYRKKLLRIMKKDWTDIRIIRRYIADFRCKLGPQFVFNSMSWEIIYNHANRAPRERLVFPGMNLAFGSAMTFPAMERCHWMRSYWVSMVTLWTHQLIISSLECSDAVHCFAR